MSLLQDNIEVNCFRYDDVSVMVIAETIDSLQPGAAWPSFMRRLAKVGLVPVVTHKKRLLGVISDLELLASSEAQLEHMQAQGMAAWIEVIPPLKKNDVIQRAIRYFEQTEHSYIPIVDEQGRYTGQCASRSKLDKLLHGLLKPVRIGGMATPLGVYMTSGYHTSGAGWQGLVATGVLFGLMVHGLDWMSLALYQGLAQAAPWLHTWGEGQQMIAQIGITLCCLLGLLRISPMSGLHAAEHMTINAIEQDLPLTEPMVRTQPREHVRCGTNLMVLLGSIEIGGISLYYAGSAMNPLGLLLYLGLWGFLIVRFWQPAGLWLQHHFTTKNPTSAQLASGIQAGEELLQKFQAVPHPVPGFFRRLWGAGLLPMVFSFMITAWIVSFLMEFLNKLV